MEEQDKQMNGGSTEGEVQQQTAAPVVSGGSSSSQRFTMTVVALVLIIAAGVAFYVWHSRTSVPGASQSAAVHYPAVVATVNGEDVSGSDLEKSVKQTQGVAAQQGADLNDANVQTEIQTQALSLLVNATLLIQAAKKDGITASSSAVDAQYAAIVAQFGGADKLKAQMDSDGLTEADLRKNIEQQIVIKAYLEKNPAYAKISVSDADVAAAYASFKAQSNSSTTPALADIASQIKDQLTQQKQQDAINTIIDGLRASSTIKMNI